MSSIIVMFKTNEIGDKINNIFKIIKSYHWPIEDQIY
jgi:hypothetical protein